MKFRLGAVRPWRHALAGCLHSCVGTVLDFHGVAPLDALGPRWSFYYARDVRREEYYYPCPPGTSLLEALVPGYPCRSRWQLPGDEQEGWTQVREQVLAGRPVIVAVDNYHLPFRPAYRDVHTNHLAIVYGFDDDKGTAWVCDEVPPAFNGEITIADLTAARHSTNPVIHARDRFFTANPIAGRWLSIELAEQPARGGHDLANIQTWLRANLAGFGPDTSSSATNGSSQDAYVGLAGQHRFLTDAAATIGADGDAATASRDELFIVAGTALAGCAIHADWLARTAALVREPGLLEGARLVERVAHHWSAIRISTAAGGDAGTLRRRAGALRADHLVALDRLQAQLEEWDGADFGV
jgi:Butirosin biosynthesis protein H, N-terminal